MNKKILAAGLLAGLAMFLVKGVKTAWGCCYNYQCDDVSDRSYSCLEKPDPCPNPLTHVEGTCYYSSPDIWEYCEQWGDYRECDALGYTTRFCVAPSSQSWRYQIAQCDASGNPIDEGGGGASCQPSGGDCMQIGTDGNYLYLGYDYQANSIVYNGSVRCVCRIWLEDHYLCYQEHCVPNYNGTAANWVSTGENCPCPADSCGVCSKNCGDGTQSCTDGYSSWQMPCNLQACDPTCILDLQPSAAAVATRADASFIATVSDIKDGTVDQVNFSSSNSSIASVAPFSDGTIIYSTEATGVAEGSAVITAEAIMAGAPRCSDTTALDVLPPEPWWQVKDADVITNGNLVSDVPLGEYFGLDGQEAIPGWWFMGELAV